MSLQITLSAISTFLSFFAVSLHTIGIYLLSKDRTSRHNQGRYLTHLSLTEIILTLNQQVFVHVSCTDLNNFTNRTTYDISTIFQTCCVIPLWIYLLVLLTYDRFLEIWLNIKYNMYITEQVTKALIYTGYVLVVIIASTAISLKCFYNMNPLRLIHRTIYPILSGITILSFFIVYAYIFKKVIKRNKICSIDLYKRNYSIPKRLSCFVPFWIVVSFVSFTVVPEIVLAVVFYGYKLNKFESPYYPLLFIVLTIGVITDALIYIFMNGALRRRFKTIFCKTSELQNEESSRRFKMVSRIVKVKVAFEEAVATGSV